LSLPPEKRKRRILEETGAGETKAGMTMTLNRNVLVMNREKGKELVGKTKVKT